MSAAKPSHLVVNIFNVQMPQVRLKAALAVEHCHKEIRLRGCQPMADIAGVCSAPSRSMIPKNIRDLRRRTHATDHLPNVRLTPGMPVEAMVQLGERGFFSYITQPIRDNFYRAFHEQ
jgi:hypothetical protein